MGMIIGALMARFGWSERAARIVAIGGLFLFILAALGAVKCAYDRNLIKKHDADQRAATAKADRKADNHAAEQRGRDAARQAAETTIIKEAIDDARSTGADPRAAYYRCVALQQRAARAGQPPARC